MNTDRNDDLVRLIRALEVLNDDTGDPHSSITSEEMDEHEERILARLRQSLAERDWPRRTLAHFPGTNARSCLRRGAAWFLTTAVVAAAYGVLETFLATLPQPWLILHVIFVIIPSLLVFLWYLDARDHEVTRRSALLDSRAVELRQLQKRIRLVARKVGAERRMCENHGLATATSRLDSLGRQLRDARKSARTLAKLFTEGSAEARRFDDTCRRDPYRALSEYNHPPPTIDPQRIGAEIDNFVDVLRLAGNVAVDIPLHMRIESKGSEMPPGYAGEIAEELKSIYGEFHRSSRFLTTECRRTLRAFDTLHSLVTTMLIKTLTRSPASRAAARAAVAASVLPQPLVRRPAMRTAFLREASASSSGSWVWIGKAAMAAIARSQKSA